MPSNPPYVPGPARYAGPILPPAATEPVPPKNGLPTWLKVLGVVALFVLVVMLGFAAAVTDEPDGQLSGPRIVALQSTGPADAVSEPAPPAKPVEPTAAASKAAPAPARTITAGTWEVPGEVKPGTYTTTGQGFNCYYARLRSFDGELSSIITNGNLSEGQRGRLTVKKTDKGVELSGDCVWTAAR